jgi:hypothetical protein
MISTDSTSDPGNGAVISPMTYALFEDSGWYIANYSFKALSQDPFVFGRNFGCSIL